MISTRTVLVLGAGASVAYGFPTGRALLLEIVDGLEPGRRLHSILTSQLSHDPARISDFRNALDRSAQPSVDAFVEKRQDFLAIGKATIAASLVPQEDPSRIARTKDLKLYEHVFGRLDSSRDGFPNNQLSIITFNYDRSLEYFMFCALKDSNGLDDQAAGELLATMPIIHVHGLLGGFAVEDGPRHRRFDPDLRTDKLQIAIDAIKVLHETEENSPEFSSARELLTKAEVIAFLGFGYLEANVTRLGARAIANKPDTRKPPDLYGSAYGLGSAEKEMILRMLHQNVELGARSEDALEFVRSHPVFRWPG